MFYGIRKIYYIIISTWNQYKEIHRIRVSYQVFETWYVLHLERISILIGCTAVTILPAISDSVRPGWATQEAAPWPFVTPWNRSPS